MPSDCYWRGDVLATKEVKTLVVGGTPANGQVYTATMNGKAVSYTASGVDTNPTIATALYDLLIDSETVPPEFREFEYEVAAATITATAVDAGVPLTVTTGATGTGTFVTTTTTTATGPNWWSAAANWSTGVAPVTGDSAYLRKSNVDILYGTDQNAVTLALLDVDASYTGRIGLPDRNANDYDEYRERFLKIGATLAFFGRGAGSGSGRVRWNAGTVQTTAALYASGSPDGTMPSAVDFVGTHASNAWTVNRGSLAVGHKPGTASTLTTLKVGSQGNAASDAKVYCGYSVTLGTLTMNGGVVDVWNGLTTANVTGGTLNASKGAFGTINNDEGTVNYDTAGTLSSYVGGTNSVLDCSRVVASRTITAAVFEAQSSFRDPAKTVTFGGSGAFIRCKVSELREFDVGEQFYFQRA
jgi:hypothetical protein